MSEANHNDVVDKIIEALKMLDLRGYGLTDIKKKDWPLVTKPSFGLILSPLREIDGDSTNRTNDVGYPVQLTRVLGSIDPSGGFTERDNWRRDVYKRFNRVRLGLDQELMTRADFDQIEIPDAWKNWNLDASVVVVTTWIRIAIGP